MNGKVCDSELPSEVCQKKQSHSGYENTYQPKNNSGIDEGTSAVESMGYIFTHVVYLYGVYIWGILVWGIYALHKTINISVFH